MSPGEVGWRVVDQARHRVWAVRSPRIAGRRVALVDPAWKIRPPGDVAHLPPSVTAEVISAANQLLAGEWEVLGARRFDMADPDWSRDPSGGPGFPTDRSSSRIDYRSGVYGNVKQVWELSRHHHVTVLACAWRLTRDDRYAEMAARHLRAWWEANPVGLGVNWSSGIEVGIRLISWVWTRRLLEGWPGAPALFEHNDDAVGQIYWHQRYVAAFPSRGSSANNHVIAELAGQLIASSAFGWFKESAGWRSGALAGLADELAKNTFASGINRELASDYHGFVADLGLLGAIEADAAGATVPDAMWESLARMLDAAAALLDSRGHGARQGDSDEGRALVVAPSANRWDTLLAIGVSVFGPLPWWPTLPTDLGATLVSGLIEHPVTVGGRPVDRPGVFADAGITILRADATASRAGDIWCRCDGGPHGFGSLAAHGHADALSVEVRWGGVEILADPGTYCYHEEPAWRTHFRSTCAHNTITLDDRDQSVSGGPFMWSSQATTRVLENVETGTKQRWSAEHDGYQRLDRPARHRRTVTLDAELDELVIVDQLSSTGPHSICLSFQLGPDIDVALHGHRAELRWVDPTNHDRRGRAVIDLPDSLTWSIHRGEVDPILGWYSPSFGTKVPAPALLGRGDAASVELTTRVKFIG
jgi:hypothetical protein